MKRTRTTTTTTNIINTTGENATNTGTTGSRILPELPSATALMTSTGITTDGTSFSAYKKASSTICFSTSNGVMSTYKTLQHSCHGDTIHIADENSTPVEAAFVRAITQEGSSSTAANHEDECLEGEKANTIELARLMLPHGNVDVSHDNTLITTSFHHGNDEHSVKDTTKVKKQWNHPYNSNLDDALFGHDTGTAASIDASWPLCQQQTLTRRQPDPWHPDPVDFQQEKVANTPNTVSHLSLPQEGIEFSNDSFCLPGKVRKFLLEMEQAHEKQLQYDPYIPDMNANNFTWVLQSHPRGLTTSGTSSIMVNYESFMFRFLRRRDEMSQKMPPTHRVVVGIGYHYTMLECIQHRIRWHGFSQPPPSTMANEFVLHNFNTTIIEPPKKASSGNVLTSNNPFSYHKFRTTDQCIMVLQLMIAPKNVNDQYNDVMMNSSYVLPSSDYGIPLMKFSSDLIETPLSNFLGGDVDRTSGNKMVFTYRRLLQTIIDKYWNIEPTTTLNILPLQVTLCNYYDLRYYHHRSKFISASTSNDMDNNPVTSTKAFTIQYIAPETVLFQSLLPASNLSTQWECAICLNGNHDSLRQTGCTTRKRTYHDSAIDAVSLINCAHIFHRDCIDECVRRTNNYNCPLCRTPISTSVTDFSHGQKYIPPTSRIGTMPSGMMQIEVCHGLFDSCESEADRKYDGVICIAYRFPKGIQKDYHVMPRQKYKSATYITYIPNCTTGREILERIQYTFVQGHLFTICSSSTIVPVLSDICHRIGKHNPYCDHSKLNPFGVDRAVNGEDCGSSTCDEYFKRIHSALDSLTIPSMEQILNL